MPTPGIEKPTPARAGTNPTLRVDPTGGTDFPPYARGWSRTAHLLPLLIPTTPQRAGKRSADNDHMRLSSVNAPPLRGCTKDLADTSEEFASTPARAGI